MRTQVNDSVELYNQNIKRLATSGVGVTIYGSGDEGVDAAIADTSFAKLDIKPGIGTFQGTAGIGITIDEWKLSDNYFRSAEYQLTVTNNTGGHVQSQKVLVMHDGSDNAFYSEWAVMYGAQGSRLVSVGATGSGGYVRLEVTPQPGFTGLSSYFFSRTAIG